MRFVEFRPSAGATYIPKSKPKKVKKVDQVLEVLKVNQVMVIRDRMVIKV